MWQHRTSESEFIKHQAKHIVETRGINIVKLIYDLKHTEPSDKEEEDFNQRQITFLLMSIGNFSLQKAQSYCGYNKSETVSQQCSKCLYKRLSTLLRVEGVRWANICTYICDDENYLIPEFNDKYPWLAQINNQLSPTSLSQEIDTLR